MIYKEQKDLINYLVEYFKNIDGVNALYLKGSIAREESDEFSDVDFYCLVDKDKYDDILSRRDEILEEYKPIYYKENVNFGLEQVIVIYNNNIHLDFYLTKEVPSDGTDQLMTLFDPKSLLNHYKRNPKIVDKTEIVNYINDAIYTLNEIYSAFNREDILWSQRLMSHIIAYLSLVMSNLYDLEKPVLHMKGLYLKVPEDIRENIDSILDLMIPANQKECVNEIIKLCELIIEKQEDEIKACIYTDYLELMKKLFKE